MVGESEDYGVVGEAALLQRIEQRRNLLVDDGVQVCVEVDVFPGSRLAVERRELPKIIARRFLHARLGREIVGVVRREIDPEIAKAA
jgi:hypothetical protein